MWLLYIPQENFQGDVLDQKRELIELMRTNWKKKMEKASIITNDIHISLPDTDVINWGVIRENPD